MNGPSRPPPSRTRPGSALPRVPLPAKLLLSYLLLLSIVAIPNYVYVRARLEASLIDEAEAQLMAVAERTAGVLAGLPDDERLGRLRDLARMSGDRITLVGAGGMVLFDSVAGPIPQSHADRPEIRAAWASGEGSARRLSDTTREDTLYAAARLPIGTAEREDRTVVRVARPLTEVRSSTEDLTRFARNVQAAAISVSFLLSLLSAIQFVRPLRRVADAAKALGGGDLAARTDVTSNDEVGDAGRAIDAMALELRRRLANAGSGDAVLAQLVDALPVPCVIFEVTGDVLALNGAARAAYGIEGPLASRRLKALTTSARFERALEAAEGDGEPEPLDVEVADNARVHSTVHVLKRPGAAPLYVLLGKDPSAPEATTLPPSDALRVRPFSDVLKEARVEAGTAMAKAGVDLEVAPAPDVLVVDLGQRVPRALAECLRAGALTIAGRGALCLDVKVETTQVAVAFEAGLGADSVSRIAPLLEPLGGRIEVDGQRSTTVWIPRA